MKTKPDPFFTKNWHGHSEGLRKSYKKVRRNNDEAAIEEGLADLADLTEEKDADG